ncbi:methyltransferase type 11 [Thamnocephalis sphaerospora]|uniref:Methyltransferase type 11 n=1 Tax=Thamnocephalis sphaerospora TaxID=78915 RepID=A0A4V1IWT0_9FUNG|nr:methyltransferase type 11 [Thamnocephalis sphaerospora]|eukprot:RKP08629.1 methyltransferase type 11 [Thamnocephalis sphaerospora]
MSVNLSRSNSSDGAASSGKKSNSKSTTRSEAFSYVDGRRYHNEEDCPYPLPNDLTEIDRLDIQHYSIQHVSGRKHHAPLDNPKRALDIGTGTGTWMLEMAADFPDCEFLGLDVAPLQPTVVLPQNCKFELANILEGIPHPDNQFDYVHHRLLIAAIPKNQWQSYVEDCVRVCASGGWVEMVETNGNIYNSGEVGKQFSELTVKAFLAGGFGIDTVDHLDDLMRDAGLQDVTVEELQIPLGKWGGRVGELFEKNYRMGLTGLTPFFTNVCGLTKEEITIMLEKAIAEFSEHHAYIRFRVYTGRKL